MREADRGAAGPVRLTAGDRLDLERIGSGPDDTAYYADWPAADWNNLKRLERRGLAATCNQSDWWRTDAGRAALEGGVGGCRCGRGEGGADG